MPEITRRTRSAPNHESLVISRPSRWQSWLPLIPIFTVISLLATAALLITSRASGRNVLTIDVTVGRWIQSADVPFGSLIATIGNAAGSTAISVSVALSAIGIALLTRRWVDVVFLVALFAARGLNTPLKAVSDSPRPSSTFLSVTEFARGYGFPSGHSMSILLVAGGLAYIVGVTLPSWRWRLVPTTAAVLVILATGYGRVHAGAHWPTDVIGGFLWGSILLLLAISLHHLLTCHASAKRAAS